MEYLIEYGMFLAKAATIALAVIVVITAISSAGQKKKKTGKKGSIKVTQLNDHIDEMREELRQTVLDKDHLKLVHKDEKKKHKAEHKEKKQQLKKEKHGDSAEDEARKKRVYVLNFKGNIAAEAVASLREEITAILSLAEKSDEVLLRLESPGGMVHAYGLASSQLLRIKNQKIPLTICVDKVAASGGYMMACLADKLVAAPFAIIGSIGVLVQLPNFHRVLKKHDVDFEMISAGEYKRTLTTFGEITQKGRDKVQEDVETIHGIFKSWVKDHRPSIEIEKIATGETWVGVQAKERYMVDEIKTSDECIVEACDSAEVFEVEYEFRKSIQDRLGHVMEATTDKLFSKWFTKPTDDSYQ
ncbi:MAG TPA: protease SohB [Gammaproteobacteria bacterium]|nr:protease SohB [Gammaproteobacteria bacterium]MDP6732264.1 protease SohB [Gammaproteobacteria bacterium]HAJ74997.1 protease SohB [Gammaproteobacteria bacterium]